MLSKVRCDSADEISDVIDSAKALGFNFEVQTWDTEYTIIIEISEKRFPFDSKCKLDRLMKAMEKIQVKFKVDGKHHRVEMPKTPSPPKEPINITKGHLEIYDVLE